MRRSMRFLFLAALIPFAVSCSDGATAPRTDIINVKPDQSTATLASGGTTTIGLTITRPIGYTGPITLDLSDVAAGVSATLSPTTLPEGAVSSTLTVTANTGTTSSSGSITVRASGTGIASQTATVGVIVGQSSSSGSFTMTASPSLVIVPKGGSASVGISIIRSGGFSDPVSIDVSGFSGDIQATSSGSIASDGNVSITVSSTAKAGTYFGVVTASAGGIVQTASITVTVTGIGGG